MILTNIKDTGNNTPLVQLDQQVLDVARVVDLKDIYSYAGTNIGMVSRYPTYNPDRDNEDYFAQRQTTTDKLANTAKTFATLASNTYANHFYGYGRTTNALASGDWDKLWKDSFGEESANIVQAQANLNPIYETKAQTARMNSGDGAWGALKQFVPFTGRAGNAWLSLAGQAGFMVGTIGAVATEEVALIGLTAATGFGTAPVAGAKTVTNVGKVMKSFFHVLGSGKQLNTIKNAAEAGNVVAKVIRSKPVEIARMYMAAAGEASIEANTRFLEFKADQIEQYKKAHYGEEPDQAFLQQIEENGIKAGNATFGFNIPVLMTGNLLTIGNMFKPGNLLLAKATREGLQESSKLLSSKAVLGGFLKNFPKAEKVASAGLKTASFLNKDKVSEGIEELLQGAGSRAAQHKYDLFNSDETASLNSYLTGVADELSHSLGTREGWDEFFSGYMTGFGLNIGKAAVGAVTGKNKKVQAAVAQEVADLDNAHQNMMKQYSEVQETVNDPFQTANNNVITQNAVSNATEQAISNNDVYEGKNLKVDAKTALFSHLNLRDIGKEYFTLLANNINALKNTGKPEDLVTFEEMTKGRSVEEIAQGLEKEYETFQQTANQIRKNSKNNYKEGTSMYNLREHIINYAAGVELASTDAKQRATGIQSKIVSEGKIDENVLQALLEPEMLGESISALKSSLETFREAAKVQVGESKVISEKEVAKVEEKLALLETLQKATQQKGQSTQDLVASVLKGYFGDANMASQEVKQDLADLLELNNDAQVYTNLYNLLSNKEYFETFAESFQKTVLSQYQAKAQKAREANYQPPSTAKERISKEELEVELGKDGITSLPELLAFKEALEIVDAISVKGGKIKYNGQEFETPADLLEHLLKGKDETRKAIESQGLKDLFTARLNEVIGNEVDAKEPLIKEPVIPTDQPAYINNSGPKSKETAEKEDFLFRTSAVGQTLLHYFDIVIGNIWGTEGIDSIRKTLEKNDKLETLDKVNKAITDVGGNASVTLIYLTNEESLFAEEGSKEKVNNSADIKVVTDGIRFYLITSESTIKEDGSKKTAQEIIEENLGLQVQGSRQAAIVRDRDGNTLVSPFRENTFDETSDNAIHTLERGQSVSLKVADNEYNRELLLKKNRKEITEKEYIDQLTVHAYVIDKNGDEAIVGILRATDFLFESNEAKKTEIEKYRQRLNGLSLGQHFGNTTYTNATVAEGRNRVAGKIVYTKLAEYNPPYYNTEFYYVTPSGIINEKGEVADIDEVGIPSVRNGAIYMKLTGKSNDKHYTVQTYGETSQADFLSGEFKNTMETYLTQDTPIISKRIIVDLGNISEADNESTKAEQVEEQLEEALPLGVKDAVEEIENKIEEVVAGQTVQEDVQVEIEAKKAEIERRRQEELTNLKVGDSYDVISSTGSYDGTWKVVEITDKFYRLTDNKGGKLNMGKPRVEENLKRPDGVTETKYRKSNRDEINAKYDAELKALEQQPTTSNVGVEESSVGVREEAAIKKLDALKTVNAGDIENPINIVSVNDIFKNTYEQGAADGIFETKQKIDVENDLIVKGKSKEGTTDIEVSVNDLMPTQAIVDKADVVSKIKGEKGSFEQSDKPLVFEKDNKYYIVDGHNRIAADILKGKEKIQVRKIEQSLKETTKTETTPNRTQEVTAERNEVSATIANTLEGFSDMFNDTYLKKFRVLTDGIKQLVHKFGTDEKAIKEFLKGQKGSLVKLVFDKHPKEFMQIVALWNEGLALKNKATVIDKTGAEIEVYNPKIEGNNLVHDLGTIDVTDIQSVEEAGTGLEVHDNGKEWAEIATKNKEAIYNWLLSNGQAGTTYTTAEGIELTVLYNDGTRIITRSVKGENTVDTLFSEGEFSTSISAKALKVSGELGQGQLALEEGKPPLSLEEAVTSQKETTPQKRVFTMLNVLKEQMAIHGVTESHIKRLQTAYQDSVLAGTPINGLSELMEKAGFTEEEIALMELTLSTATHQNFWEYITQSETFYEEKVLEDYAKVKEEMASYIEQLANIPLGESPVEVENKYIDDIWNKLKSTFSKIGSITFEIDKLSSIPREAISKVTTALQELMEEDSFDNLELKLREVGVKIRLKGLLYSQKVDRWSLGRNPKRADSFNSIQNDVRMFSENYVRNEADGLFVEITPSLKKSTQEIRKIQKLFVDLLGINVDTGYLHSYKKVNGNFEGLMDRLQLEQMKEKSVAVQELVNIPKEDIVESTKDFIVTKRKGDRLFQDGERYNLLSVDNTENRVYLKEGSTISATDYNRLTKNPKKTSTYINRNTTLGKKAVRIKKELAKITCKA